MKIRLRKPRHRCTHGSARHEPIVSWGSEPGDPFPWFQDLTRCTCGQAWSTDIDGMSARVDEATVREILAKLESGALRRIR